MIITMVKIVLTNINSNCIYSQRNSNDINNDNISKEHTLSLQNKHAKLMRLDCGQRTALYFVSQKGNVNTFIPNKVLDKSLPVRSFA